jgi:hypothetical protein
MPGWHGVLVMISTPPLRSRLGTLATVTYGGWVRLSSSSEPKRLEAQLSRE